MNAATPAARFEVTCNMEGLASRAGTALLSGLCDRIGLAGGLVDARSARARVWDLADAPVRVILDIDATHLRTTIVHADHRGRWITPWNRSKRPREDPSATFVKYRG